MRLRQIAIAIAVLGATPAALALTPDQIDGTTARLWLSGSSSISNAVFKGVLPLCKGMAYKDATGVTHINPGVRDAHLYLESSTAGSLPGSAGDLMAYTCTVQTDDGRAGSLEGKKVIVFHTVEGGSFNAYSPHLKIAGDPNTNIPSSLKRTANIEGLGAAGQCASGAASSESVDISGIANPVGVYRGCAITQQNFTAGQALRANVFQNPDRPEGGFSDTEYVINKLNLDVATDIDAIGWEVPTNIGQAFGVAVSYPLYFQLQKNDIAAGLIAATCDDGASPAATNLSLACQPNLAAQRYTAIANVASIAGKDGSLFGGAPGSIVQLARRAITSGTQSASNLRFLNKPCATGAPQGALNPARAADSTATVKVTEKSSTGGVKTTLTTASNNGQFGLGVVSMENKWKADTDRWAFVKLNGTSPNSDAKQRANAIEGSYDFWYELVAFTANTAFQEGIDLIAAAYASLGNPNFTDLDGLFVTPMAGITGSNVSTGARIGNSCRAAIQ